MSDIVSIEGPIDLEDGRLILRIPLAAGGDKLAPFAAGIGKVEGEELVVEIQPWLAKMLNVDADSLVVVDNAEGKFRVTRSAANDST